MKTPKEETGLPRYVVGIDLGTTNSALCYVDTEDGGREIGRLTIPQFVAPGQIEGRHTLPSFLYQPTDVETKQAEHWDAPEFANSGFVVGEAAREQGRVTPDRVIESAKSWLCHPAVDRTAPLLPWNGAADVEMLSPVEASAAYLRHLRDVWDERFPEHCLADQDIVITLPASFDEVARELTVAASQKAGLPRVVLIEEPQAAFYAWIAGHEDAWEEQVAAGDRILICDIGGGTTDFTLLHVRRQSDGDVEFRRVAVGDHLLLGGDNLDLALAHQIESDVSSDGKPLPPRQWSRLVRQCRRVKEQLFSADAPATLGVTLAGSGAKLIGGAMQTDVHRDDAREQLLEGFLPFSAFGDQPTQPQSGFRELSLPYAADSAITRYLSAFLAAHDVGTSEASGGPEVILFNGGFFASPLLRQRLLDVMSTWFGGDSWSPKLLANERLDLAVAEGAAYFGLVRRGQGVRIAAGLARTYYIGVAARDAAAVCLVPAGTESETRFELDRDFSLSLSAPVQFPLYYSSTRLTDEVGSVVSVTPEELTALPPIRTVLKGRSSGEEAAEVTVRVHAGLTELGTLDLWCADPTGGRRWQLQFDVRASTQTDRSAHDGVGEQQGVLDESTVAECCQQVRRTFSGAFDEKPSGLAKRLGRTLELSRQAWPTTLLRRFWETLIDVESGRRKSQEHEGRWLNLLGFSLRPGFGLALDDWRVAETWRILKGKLVHGTPLCRTEWWILWRRIAGGLAAGQQTAFSAQLVGLIQQRYRQVSGGRGRPVDYASNPHEEAEIWRMLGSFERLDLRTKIELGNVLADWIPKKKYEACRPALAWALGRIGARVPVYGPLNTLVPAETASQWLTRLLDFDYCHDMGYLAVMLLSRRTDDRYRDVDPADRRKALRWMEAREAPAHHQALVREVGQLESDEQAMVFGESLPQGLRLQ